MYSRFALCIGLGFAAGSVSILAYNHWVQRRRHINHHVHENQSPEVLLVPEGIEGCIGETRLFKVKSLSEATGCEIYAKAEFLNGAGNSPKDRAALHFITSAEKSGLLIPNAGYKIYEGSVGSTGISLATICRARGYQAHIVMPSDQAKEKADLLTMLGAEVEIVKPNAIVDEDYFVNRARIQAEKDERGLFINQFENEANWEAHYQTTGPEIYKQTGGNIDAFVSGAGTGGTISGVARFLKPRIQGLQIILADPQGSGLLNRVKYGVMYDPQEQEGTRRRHQVDSIVEGIGLNRVTANFEAGRQFIDDAVRVTDQEAMAMAQWLMERDGIFIGSSSAVNCVAATRWAFQNGPRRRIVTILCDSGSRHVSKFWARIKTEANICSNHNDLQHENQSKMGNATRNQTKEDDATGWLKRHRIN